MKKFKFFKKPTRDFWKSKKLWASAGIVAAVVVGAFALFTAFQDNTIYQTALANVAEARHYMKAAESDTLKVQFFSGTREEPYNQDGKANNQTPFAIINVDPKDNSLKDFLQIEGTVTIAGEQIPIVLDKNPYDRNFATDIARLVEQDKAVEVTLFITSTNHPTFTLENTMGSDAITWTDALEIATDKLGSKIKKSNYEVYVKIINDVADDTGAFWYVQFICTDGCTHFCVVAPDGSVIAS